MVQDLWGKECLSVLKASLYIHLVERRFAEGETVCLFHKWTPGKAIALQSKVGTLITSSPQGSWKAYYSKEPNAFSWLWGVKTLDWEKLEESSFLWDLALPPPHCVTLGSFLTFLNLSCLISIVGIMILPASCVCSGHYMKWRLQVFLDHGKCSVNISSVFLSLGSITRKDPIPCLLRGSYSFWKGIALA